MRPTLLLNENTGANTIADISGEFSIGFDCVFDSANIEYVLKSYSNAIVFAKPEHRDEGDISELVSLCEKKGASVVFILDESDQILPGLKNNPFSYITLPVCQRQLKMVIHYHNEKVYGKYRCSCNIESSDTVNSSEPSPILPLTGENDDRYRKIFESIPMISIQGYNEERQVVFWNKASEMLYGYREEEALGRKIEDLIIPEEMRALVVGEISNYFGRNQKIPESELELKKKDGRKVHVFSSHLMLKNSAGKKELYCVDLDLTQVKRHQLIQEVLSEIAAATNAIEDLKDFLKSLRVSLSRVVNTRNFFIALYNEEENTFSLPVFIDDADQFRSFPAGRTLTAYMLKNKKPLLLNEAEMDFLEEQDIIDRVGTPCKIWLGVPLRKDDKVIGALVLQSYTDDTIYDETDMRILQIVAEQVSIAIEKKARQEQLKEGERALKTLISNLPGIAYRCKVDQNWTMEFLSDGFTTLTGFPVEDFLGNRNRSYSNLIHSDDRSDVWNQVMESVRNDEHYYLVYRIISNGGHVKYVWEKGRSVHNEKQEVVALEGFIIDITDRIEMEQQIVQAKEKAEESDRLKSAFLANLSHEIRSPMNSIVGFSQLLKSGDARGQESQYADIIFQSSKQLLDVINDIVDIARIESGQLVVKKDFFRPLDLVNEMKHYAGDLLSRNTGKNLDVKLNIDSSLTGMKIKSDELLLRKVLMHLVNNAVKFTFRGSVEIGFIALEETACCFFVKDTGIGISSDDQEIVFERFRQVDESATRSFEGTGLGLSISRGIASLLGGKISVESTQSNGSVFRVKVPVY